MEQEPIDWKTKLESTLLNVDALKLNKHYIAPREDVENIIDFIKIAKIKKASRPRGFYVFSDEEIEKAIKNLKIYDYVYSVDSKNFLLTVFVLENYVLNNKCFRGIKIYIKTRKSKNNDIAYYYIDL